jgi:ATP-dependent helicase/DNAse subunit B
MQVRFLLGPAGSGKTWRCLEEIRGELISDPTGPPLILLAPKQATFQLERQLLADDRLHGYTRLQILSFDRLADYVLEQLSVERSEMLSEEGRVMVLRALLARLKEDLEMYRSSAQLPGFAQQLSLLLREMHRFRIRPTTLERLVSNEEIPVALRQKLHDIGLIMSGYRDWLDERGLKDVDEVLDMAAAGLRRLEIPSRLDRKQPPPILLAGLWLDGFAEMTPQESDLLAAILPYCERSHFAWMEKSGQASGQASSVFQFGTLWARASDNAGKGSSSWTDAKRAWRFFFGTLRAPGSRTPGRSPALKPGGRRISPAAATIGKEFGCSPATTARPRRNMRPGWCDDTFAKAGAIGMSRCWFEILTTTGI